MTTMTKEEIVKELKEGVCNVIYIYGTGPEGTQHLTLHPSFLPQPNEDGTYDNNTIDSPGTITCWNVNLKEWIIFRIDSILMFNGRDFLSYGGTFYGD